MPTNGAFDDVLVRLPAAFLERDDGTPDLQIYKTNLAITEALVRRHNVPIAATDERALDSDLDRDGQLGTATRIAYDWAPVEQREMHYVGRADRQSDGKGKGMSVSVDRGGGRSMRKEKKKTKKKKKQ